MAASSDESSGVVCHCCRHGALTRFEGFAGLSRVASDCRPWPAGGALGLCQACGLVQKVVDAGFHRDAADIYASYRLYHQTAGQTEQLIFDQQSGVGKPRSELILGSLLGGLGLPEQGRMLDMGCGTGPTLRAFSGLVRGWSLFGYDPHLSDRERVAAIPGVEAVYDGDARNIDGTFDLVTAVHVLEHVPDPFTFLQTVRRCLAPGGLSLIQVPYFPDTPFDLLVADHCSHFSLASIAQLCLRAGLEPVLLSADQLPKEITIVARRGEPREAAQPPDLSSAEAAVRAGLDWLHAVQRQATESVAAPLGVFGTSIGGNWLLGLLGERLEFFVDEDPGRAQTSYRERLVLRPEQVSPGSTVLVPLPAALAARIRARLAPQAYDFVLPPEYATPARF